MSSAWLLICFWFLFCGWFNGCVEVTKAGDEVGKMRWLRKKNYDTVIQWDLCSPWQHGNTFQGTVAYPTSGKGKSSTQDMLIPRRLQHFFIALSEGFGRYRHADSSHHINESILDASGRMTAYIVHIKRFSLENLSDPKSENHGMYFFRRPDPPEEEFRTNNNFCSMILVEIYNMCWLSFLFFKPLKN